MSRVNDLKDKVINWLEKEDSFAWQAVSSDADELKELADSIEETIKNKPEYIRCYRIDMKEYMDLDLPFGEALSKMLNNLLCEVFNDSKFSESDTRTKASDITGDLSKTAVSARVNDVIVDDFMCEMIMTLIIVEHFEYGAKLWTPSDLGYMRELVDGKPYISMLLTSSQMAGDVTQEPTGSSPFYNIFGLNAFN